MVEQARFRLGAWLSRPRIAALQRHYHDAMMRQRESHPDQSRNCAYISIGLSYANDPRKLVTDIDPHGFDGSVVAPPRSANERLGSAQNDGDVNS